MEKKKKIDLKVILVSILLVLTLIPLINEFLAFGNPAKYNPRIDYLEPGDAVDAYLHTGENIITITFLGIVIAFFVVILLDLLLRKKSSHVSQKRRAPSRSLGNFMSQSATTLKRQTR